TDEEQAVGAHLHLFRSQLLRARQAEQQPLVLRDVVGLLAEEPADACEDAPLRIEHHRARARRPGIPPRRPVAEDAQPLAVRARAPFETRQLLLGRSALL